MRGPLLLAVVIALPLLAGCLGGDEVPEPVTDDPSITIQGTLLDADDETPLEGAIVELTTDTQNRRITDAEGGFRFAGLTPGPCLLGIQADGYASGELELDCGRDRHLTVRLERELSYGSQRPPSVQEDPLVPGAEPEDPTFALTGTVADTAGPVAGATVTLDVVGAQAPSPIADNTDSRGGFRFVVAPGTYTLHASAPCAVATETTATVTDADTRTDIHLAESDRSPPSSPQTLSVVPGPGPAQTTLTWQAPAEEGGAPVERYHIQRDGAAFTTVGNTLAYGDTGADLGGHTYAVAAENGCGSVGPWSQTVDGTPLPGALVDAPVGPATDITSTLHTYPVLDAAGNVTGNRTWRTFDGLGNCCETYVAASADGRLFEYGGSILYYSDDEGLSWNQVSNVLPALGAEGAIVGAPGGDMLAVNWDPYSGDQLWSHKYVAATDTWYTARTPLNQPFFDRPWVAVIEGPFEVQGVVVPYVSFLMSNYVHGDILLMSLDGLHYQPPTARLVTTGDQPIPTDLPPDPDRDWTQSIQETSVYPVDGGHGLRDRALLGTCDMAALSPDLQWRCATWPGMTDPPGDGEVLRVDGDGRFHVFTVVPGDRSFDYRVSADGGSTWDRATLELPRDLVIEDWDVQANAGLDQVVIVLHASKSIDASTEDQDLVYRFTDLADGIHLEEILLVGLGDHVFGGGLTSEYDRFDYTTVALLPSGHVALSFGDSEHVPPSVAVEVS